MDTGKDGKDTMFIQNVHIRGARGAQLVGRLILDVSSGHDLTISGTEPRVGLCADSVEPAWESLPLSLSAPPAAHSLSLKINKLKKKARVYYAMSDSLFHLKSCYNPRRQR